MWPRASLAKQRVVVGCCFSDSALFAREWVLGQKLTVFISNCMLKIKDSFFLSKKD